MFQSTKWLYEFYTIWETWSCLVSGIRFKPGADKNIPTLDSYQHKKRKKVKTYQPPFGYFYYKTLDTFNVS